MAKTIFILGAGASIPYGFPSGRKLVVDITKELSVRIKRDDKPILDKDQHLLGLLLEKYKFSQIEGFVTALRKSGASSIDAFLSNRQEYREIGKMAIAYIILKYERKSIQDKLLFNPEVFTWYNYLWDYLISIDKIKSFSIYTFNYDRSLEYFLSNSVKNLRDYTDQQVVKYLQYIPITHLHGVPGNLPDLNRYNSIQYGNSTFNSFMDLKSVSEKIKIIYEADSPEFLRFQSDFEVCTNVIFLGFGFNLENLKRLGFVDRTINYRGDQGINFYINAFGFKDNEIENYIKQYFLDLRITKFSNSMRVEVGKYLYVGKAENLEFLREHFAMHKLFL